MGEESIYKLYEKKENRKTYFITLLLIRNSWYALNPNRIGVKFCWYYETTV